MFLPQAVLTLPVPPENVPAAPVLLLLPSEHRWVLVSIVGKTGILLPNVLIETQLANQR